MGYKEDRKIDKYLLDDENEIQAALYGRWSDAHADAELDLDKAKERMDTVKADLYMEIVKEFIDRGEKKPTETMIGNTILSKDKYKEVTEEYFKAKHNAKILKGAKESMNHRKSSLENLTHLWLGGYWADPKVPPEARKRFTEENSVQMGNTIKNRPERLKRRPIKKKGQ